MSVRAVQWALEVKVGDATAKLVLLALADEADSDGLCWPFMRRLAARAEVSEKTISRKIAYLKDAGLLEVSDRKRRRSGRLSGYNYTLALPPQDTMSDGDGAAHEDAAGTPDAPAPAPHATPDPQRPTGGHDGTSPAPDDVDHTTAAAEVAGADRPPPDNVSPGPPDTAVSPGPPDTQVSGGKEDPPCTDPPPPTPDRNDDGGGGPADADKHSPALAAILDQLDDLRRRRLLSEPAPRLHALEVILHARTVDGWTPHDLAGAVTDGSLDGAALLTAVLASRAQQLAGAEPPRARRRDADSIPLDVRLELEARVQEEALTGDVVDPERSRRRLEELTAAWAAGQHREVATR